MDDKPLPAEPSDVDSLDGIVNALYAAVSFGEGETPQWSRFRSLFHPRAHMVRVDTDPERPIVLSSIDDYVTRTMAAIESGALTAFVERELTRRTEVFGDLAQVFSTYERSASAGELFRGINNLQLVKSDARWWILSVSWTDESEHNPLPNRYLPR